MPPSGLDELDAKAEQSKRRHRTPPPPKRTPPDPPAATETPEPPAAEVPAAEVPEQPAGPTPAPVPAAPATERKAAPPAAPSKTTTRPPRRPAAAAPVDPALVASTVKVAQDHALAYGAVIRKEHERLELWLAGIKAAREAGAPPGLLRAGLEAAANRAGLPVEQIPAVVWTAAGLTPPR
uniref:ORF13 n=1 Tax=Amycolatopsis benzoatilytica TaxID=346045 RepID=A3FG46_9PSEU|nr:ORF13 [Amycolatopsis benzoatilytica]